VDQIIKNYNRFVCKGYYDNSKVIDEDVELYGKNSHLFVFRCVMDKQIKADKASSSRSFVFRP
jgi:hypothetical protein